MKASDPPRIWTRLDFDLEKLRGLDARERSELETDRDLVKPIQQLVCDFHEETAKADDSGVGALDYGKFAVHAQKRMVSMMAQVALSNKKLQCDNDVTQRRLYYLNVIVTVLTLLSLITGGIQAAGVIVSWMNQPEHSKATQ
jgi:hypothetical protein